MRSHHSSHLTEDSFPAVGNLRRLLVANLLLIYWSPDIGPLATSFKSGDPHDPHSRIKTNYTINGMKNAIAFSHWPYHSNASDRDRRSLSEEYKIMNGLNASTNKGAIFFIRTFFLRSLRKNYLSLFSYKHIGSTRSHTSKSWHFSSYFSKISITNQLKNIVVL